MFEIDRFHLLILTYPGFNNCFIKKNEFVGVLCFARFPVDGFSSNLGISQRTSIQALVDLSLYNKVSLV